MDDGNDINIWPSVLDTLAAALMVFVLASYVQSTIRLDDLHSLQVRERKDAFELILRKRMAGPIARGELRISPRQHELLLRFSDQVLFDQYQHRLKHSGRTLLRQLARVIASTADGRVSHIRVDGHTDDSQIRINPRLRHEIYPANNWELSTARATSVVTYLSTSMGLLPENLFSANGYSSFKPIAPNRHPTGRALNRRIEITLLFEDQDSGYQALRSQRQRDRQP